MKIRLPFLLCVILLSGCSALGDNPALRTVGQFAEIKFVNPSGQPSFDPHYRYLRVVVAGQTAYLALGNVDRGSEFWYSAEGEVLRIESGRMAGIMGTPIEWRNVVLPDFPSWKSIAARKSYNWTRRRDVMPGYRYGVIDELTLHAIEPRKDGDLQGIDPDRLAWFEEDSDRLPPARYAVDLAKDEVVYAETCLSKSFCFSWQRWK